MKVDRTKKAPVFRSGNDSAEKAASGPEIPVADQLALDPMRQAWESVIVHKKAPEASVRPIILRSWHRCLARALDPYQITPALLPQDELVSLLEENRELIEISAPVLQMIEIMIKNTPFILTLADHNGHVLLMLGDDEVLEMAIRNTYLPGSIRTIERSGTNAIGLCLIEGKPIQVTGAEHFNVHHHPWTCSSAPFHDDQGRLTGVVTISGKSQGQHQHTLALVTSAAGTIEARLRERALIKEKQRLNSMLISIHNSISDGVVAVDNDLAITHLNSIAGRMLGLDPETAVGLRLSEAAGPDEDLIAALNARNYFSGREIHFHRQDGVRPFIVRIDPIHNDMDHALGAIITLSEKRDVINIAKRIGGNYAKYDFKDIKGHSPALFKQIEMAKIAAKTDSRVLIFGESGTGKEMFAQAIHNHSRRRNEPFVAISCAAIPRDLIESELFGYRGGAFTGARREGMIGKFELANKGTLFLDEINGLPLDLQAKLLRALQQNEIMRLGDTHPIPVDVRIIAATNADLMKEAENANFRKDLFYRLNTVEIFIPPLRNRLECLETLVDHIMERQASKMGMPKPRLSGEVMDVLKKYQWPGNVRELENCIERAVLLAQGGSISLDHLPDRLKDPSNRHREAPSSLRKGNQEIIRGALARCKGNISLAAKQLNIARSTLYRKMREYGMMDEE